jgi:hypothetical protein
MTAIASNSPSICVPFIFSNISRARIRQVFEELELGKIACLDVHIGRNCQRAFIYFDSWNATDRVDNIKARLLDGKELKVIYSDPWYWKCYLNRGKRPTNVTGASSGGGAAREHQLTQLRNEYNIMLKSKNAEIKALYDLISELSDGQITNLDTMLLRRKRTQQRIANS